LAIGLLPESFSVKVKVLKGGFGLWLGDSSIILSMVKRAHPLLSNIWGPFDVRKRENVFFSNSLDKQRMQLSSFASPRTRSCMQHKIPANTCILGVSYTENLNSTLVQTKTKHAMKYSK
jgi:hypothetical protein